MFCLWGPLSYGFWFCSKVVKFTNLSFQAGTPIVLAILLLGDSVIECEYHFEQVRKIEGLFWSVLQGSPKKKE